MKWLGGCAAIVTFCIMAGTATATTSAATAAAPTCANDICHIRTIRGSLQLMNVAFATCTEFDSNAKTQGDIKNGILQVARDVKCGFSGGVCTASDVTLKCIGPITSSRRLLSSTNNTRVDYSINNVDDASIPRAISQLSNSTAVGTTLSTTTGISVTQDAAPTSGILDSASNRAVCKGFSLFPSPSAGGANAGNCTDPMFGGDVCSPVCDSHSRLTRNTICSEAGIVQQAICSTKGCTCQNGVGSTGSNCTQHATAHCSSCNVGFHLVAGACIPNVCQCPNGRPVLGTACTTHNSIHCRDCQAGHHLSGAAKCVACTAGHYQNVGNFSGTSCEACAKGTAVQGRANTACTPCIAGTTGSYTNQRGQATCTPQPTLSCSGTKVPSEPKVTEERTCVSDCNALKYHYEQHLKCHTQCKVSGTVSSNDCINTRNTFRKIRCACRRRRTRL